MHYSDHVLPEGFQLADHPRFGRVIAINPKPDADESAYLLLPSERALYGYTHSWALPHELELIQLEDDPHALPEGFRPADHPWHGRVLVAPKPDIDGFLRLLYPDEDASYEGYARDHCFPDVLEFLD